MTIEDRLRRAMSEHAAGVGPGPDRWEEIEARAQQRQTRRRLAVVSSAAAVAAGLALAVVLNQGGGRRVVTVTPPRSTTSTSTTSTTTATTIQATVPGYALIWPFRSRQEADAWQQSGDGHQPWHLDPAQTALDFANGYLGFTEVTTVLGQTTDGRGAHVSVGYATSPGHVATAAVVHLIRVGAGADAPWEVVGTDDASTFTITAPAYGSSTRSPVVVGGRITGVDESIRVTVRELSSPTLLGQSCCLPAGGSNTPWHTSVTFAGATDPVVMIVASTGGHLQAVERFVVTAVQPAP